MKRVAEGLIRAGSLVGQVREASRLPVSERDDRQMRLYIALLILNPRTREHGRKLAEQFYE